MIAQYTQAAIVSELKRLAGPRQRRLRSRRSAMQEDHVSMGWSAARKLRRAVDGSDPGAGDRDPDRRARGSTCARRSSRRRATGAAIEQLRRTVAAAPGPTDTSSPDIEATVDLVALRRAGGRRRCRPLLSSVGIEPRGRSFLMTRPRHARSAPARGTDADRDARGRPRRRCGC